MRTLPIIALLAACSGGAPPPPTDPTGPTEPPRTATEPDPVPTEVVELPWEGEVVEPDPDLCPSPRSPMLDPATGVFARIERRPGGLELKERATYRQGPATEVEIHARGCSHDTVTIRFLVADATPVDRYEHYRDLMVALLEALPVTSEPPNHPSALARAIKTGKRNPDTTIEYSGDPTITFDVAAAADGLIKLEATYDFPL